MCNIHILYIGYVHRIYTYTVYRIYTVYVYIERGVSSSVMGLSNWGVS